MATLENFFNGSGFMPHGCCYMWNPALIWLHVVSDGLIALAYYSIPLTLVYFVRRRRDLVFDWMFLCFAVFIVACGTTHLMEIFNIWHPTYWLSGILKAITALTSIVTAILLVRLVPQALALPSPEQLRKTNEALEQEIRERTRAADQVTVLNQELMRQTSQLETANRELEAFGYSVSHDLRAPLRHIDGYVEILRTETPHLGSDANRYMEIISNSSRQMGVLIDNLLAFSRMGSSALAVESVDPRAIVETTREMLSQESRGRNVEWTIDPLPSVQADPTLFQQVWMNLIGNALKYTRYRERAEIHIGCEEKKEEYEFFVADNGAGFDMRHVDKLFGIFQRLHFKEFEGTGIGLANVRRIISRHGGRTWGRGEPDVGATFFFTLPKILPK